MTISSLTLELFARILVFKKVAAQDFNQDLNSSGTVFPRGPPTMHLCWSTHRNINDAPETRLLLPNKNGERFFFLSVYTVGAPRDRNAAVWRRSPLGLLGTFAPFQNAARALKWKKSSLNGQIWLISTPSVLKPVKAATPAHEPDILVFTIENHQPFPQQVLHLQCSRVGWSPRQTGCGWSGLALVRFSRLRPHPFEQWMFCHRFLLVIWNEVFYGVDTETFEQ